MPSLKQFLRDVAKAVPAPKGGTVYDSWQKENQPGADSPSLQPKPSGTSSASRQRNRKPMCPSATWAADRITPCSLQHLGVPSADVSSTGSYGVYHSAFDNFNWFKKFGDPDFVYEQQMARIFGISIIRMADADVLPYDYEEYAKEIVSYIDSARKKAQTEFAGQKRGLCRGFRCSASLRAGRSEDSCSATRFSTRCRQAEPGFARRRASAPHARGIAESSLVSPCNLRSRPVHRICGGRDPWN